MDAINQPATTETGAQPSPAALPTGTTDPQEGANPLADGAADLSAMIAAADPEVLMSLLDGNIQSDVAAETAPETDANQTAPEAGEQPPKATLGASDQGEPKSFQRLSVRGIPHDQQVALAEALKAVKDGSQPDVFTALAAITGWTPGAAETQGDQSGQDDPQPSSDDRHAPPAPLTELNSRLTDLREQRRQAKADFDQEAEDRLTNEIEDTLLDIQVARVAAEREQQQAQSYEHEFAESVERVEAKYSAYLDDPESPFGELLDNAVVAMKARDDSALGNPAFIEAVADKIARSIGIGGGTTAAPRNAPSPLTPPPARSSRPVGSAVAPGNSQAPRYTPDQVRQLIESAPLEALEAVALTE